MFLAYLISSPIRFSWSTYIYACVPFNQWPWFHPAANPSCKRWSSWVFGQVRLGRSHSLFMQQWISYHDDTFLSVGCWSSGVGLGRSHLVQLRPSHSHWQVFGWMIFVGTRMIRDYHYDYNYDFNIDILHHRRKEATPTVLGHEGCGTVVLSRRSWWRWQSSSTSSSLKS